MLPTSQLIWFIITRDFSFVLVCRQELRVNNIDSGLSRLYLQWILNDTRELCVSPRSFAAEHAYIPEWLRPTRCRTSDLVDIMTPHETFCVTGKPCNWKKEFFLQLSFKLVLTCDHQQLQLKWTESKAAPTSDLIEGYLSPP